MDIRIKNIVKYLTDKKVFTDITSIEPINTGASGAKLFLISDSKNNYVLKNAHHNNGGHINSYINEYDFYKLNDKLKLPFVPETLYYENHRDYGIVLVLCFYKPISHNEWDTELLLKAVGLCAELNSLDIETVSDLNLNFNKVKIDHKFAKQSYEAWKYVINRHTGYFDSVIIDKIYKNLDIVCPILNAEPHYICHGDFHPENILSDGKKLFICDWQNISLGKCMVDISFFISRATAFGIEINDNELFDYYCAKLSEYRQTMVDKSILQKDKDASVVLNTFLYWAYYLKDGGIERISPLFESMVNSFNNLNK